MSSPGPIAKLQRSFAYRLSQRFPAQMLRWMDLVSARIDQEVAPFAVSLGMADSSAQMSWDAATPGVNIVGTVGSTNIVSDTPTANNLLTITKPPSFVRIVVRNRAANTFNIDLAFTGSTVAIGSPTYVPPGGEVEILYDSLLDFWMVQPKAQSSLVVLTGGVSALIPCDVSTRTSFSAVLATYNGVPGVAYVKSADTVIGTRRGGGGFKVHSITLATGADVATDNGTYWWTAEGL